MISFGAKACPLGSLYEGQSWLEQSRLHPCRQLRLRLLHRLRRLSLRLLFAPLHKTSSPRFLDSYVGRCNSLSSKQKRTARKREKRLRGNTSASCSAYLLRSCSSSPCSRLTIGIA